MVTEGRTLSVITQVSSGLKKITYIHLKYEYLHVKIASFSQCKIPCHCRSNSLWPNFWLCIVSVDYVKLSPLTEDTSVITVSSCGVKLQEVLSGLEEKHWTYHALLWLFFFLFTWGITKKEFSRLLLCHVALSSE